MIPKILHQVWLGGKPIPEKFLIWRNNWRKLHPNWKHILWTEENINELQEVIDYINGAPSFTSKSNIIRIYVLKKFGGVYSDMDVDWNRNIDEFLNLKAFICEESPRFYCGAIFGSEAGNPWVSYLVSIVGKYHKIDPPWGSMLMTEGTLKFSEHVTVLPSYYFYPYSFQEPFKDASRFPASYAVHHWDKLWSRQLKDELETENMIKGITSMKDTRLNAEEYRYIVYQLVNINFLVFGTGYDVGLLSYANKCGTTIFLEGNPQKIISREDTYHVSYSSDIDPDLKLIDEFDKKEYKNLKIELPDVVNKINWDFILVNSPVGNPKGCSGRLQSVFTAYHLSSSKTQIFIRAHGKEVEELYNSRMFKIIKKLDKLYHCEKIG